MKKYINTSNYYLSTITSKIEVSPNSGTFDVLDVTVDGVTLPEKGYYWVDVDFGDVSKREIFRVKERNGYTLIYDKRISPYGKKEHPIGATVALRDFSELLNSLSTNTDNFGEVEITGDLSILVRGGNIYLPGNTHAEDGKIYVDDKPFTFDANTTSYIVLEYEYIEGVPAVDFFKKTGEELLETGQYPIAKIVAGNNRIEQSGITDLRANIIGQGNMRKEVYDPDGISDDVFDMDNMKEGTSNMLVHPADLTLWNGYATTKQDTLISGTNIKTINDTSILGSGNIDTNQVSNDAYSCDWLSVTDNAPSKNAVYNKIESIETEISGKQDTLTAGDNIQICGTTISSTDTTYAACDFDIKDLTDSTALRNKWNNKQNALVAGANIQIDGNTISSINTTYSAGAGLSLTGTQFSNTGVLCVNGCNGCVSIDEFTPENTGCTGQVLKKTATGYGWDTESDAVTSVNGQTGAVCVEEFCPTNIGETGQVLKKTSTGYSWGNESGGGGGDYTAGDGINISAQNEISNTGVLSFNGCTGCISIDYITSNNCTYDNIIYLSQSDYDCLQNKDPNTLYSTPDSTDGEGFAPANSGCTGQILTKTANSYQWSDALVSSVNGQTGVVSLSIPANTSDLCNDSGFVTNQVSDCCYSADWNGDTTHAPSKNAVYNKVSTIAEVPSGGTEGQVLTKGASGFGWANAGGGDLTLLATLTRRGSETLSITGYKAILFVATYRYGSSNQYYASSATIPTDVISTITQGGGTLKVEMKKLNNDNTAAYVDINSSLVFSNNSSADPIYVYGIN